MRVRFVIPTRFGEDLVRDINLGFFPRKGDRIHDDFDWNSVTESSYHMNGDIVVVFLEDDGPKMTKDRYDMLVGAGWRSHKNRAHLHQMKWHPRNGKP